MVLQVQQQVQVIPAAWMASSSFDSKNHNQKCLTEKRETISCDPDQSCSRGDAADGIVKKVLVQDGEAVEFGQVLILLK